MNKYTEAHMDHNRQHELSGKEGRQLGLIQTSVCTIFAVAYPTTSIIEGLHLRYTVKQFERKYA